MLPIGHLLKFYMGINGPSQLYWFLWSVPITIQCLPWLSMVAQACNSGSGEAEAGRSLSLWPSQSTEGIPNQPGLDSETVKESRQSAYVPGPLQKRGHMHCHTLSLTSVERPQTVRTLVLVWVVVCLVLRQSLCVGQAGLQFKEILPPLPPKCYDKRHAPPRLALCLHFIIHSTEVLSHSCENADLVMLSLTTSPKRGTTESAETPGNPVLFKAIIITYL